MDLKDTFSSISELSASVEQKDSNNSIDNAINLMTLCLSNSFPDIEILNDAINSESKDDCKNLAVIENEKSKDDSRKRINVEDEVENIVNPFILSFDENDKIKVLTHDEFIDETLLSNIDDIWDVIKTDESSDMIKFGLHKLLTCSHNKIIATYLIKHHILKKIMEQVQNKPEFMEICFDIILKISKICKSEQTIINWIGNSNQFAMLILNQLKSTDNLVLNNLLKILQLAVHNIKIKDYESDWLFHFKKYGSFAYDINAILRRHYHEKLTITAIVLIRDMTKIKLPNRCTLLEELFKIPELISALMISSAQVLVAKKKLNSPINLDLYLYNWLAIIANIKSHLCITFDEEKEKFLFMKILAVILYPYQEEGFSFVGREIKQDLHVIFKCLRLLYYIHLCFIIPMLISRILMKITLNLRADVDSKETSFEADTKKLLEYLLSELHYVWICFIQCYNSKYIIELMKLFGPVDRQYFIDLASCHPKKNLKIINALKKVN